MVKIVNTNRHMHYIEEIKRVLRVITLLLTIFFAMGFFIDIQFGFPTKEYQVLENEVIRLGEEQTISGEMASAYTLRAYNFTDSCIIIDIDSAHHDEPKISAQRYCGGHKIRLKGFTLEITRITKDLGSAVISRTDYISSKENWVITLVLSIIALIAFVIVYKLPKKS